MLMLCATYFGLHFFSFWKIVLDRGCLWTSVCEACFHLGGFSFHFYLFVSLWILFNVSADSPCKEFDVENVACVIADWVWLGGLEKYRHHYLLDIVYECFY